MTRVLNHTSLPCQISHFLPTYIHINTFCIYMSPIHSPSHIIRAALSSDCDCTTPRSVKKHTFITHEAMWVMSKGRDGTSLIKYNPRDVSVMWMWKLCLFCVVWLSAWHVSDSAKTVLCYRHHNWFWIGWTCDGTCVCFLYI